MFVRLKLVLKLSRKCFFLDVYVIPMWFTVHVFGRGSRCVDHSVRKFKCDDHGMTLFGK